MDFEQQAKALWHARIREQYKLDDRSRRLGVTSRQLPPSLTAGQIAHRFAKNANFGFQFGRKGLKPFLEVVTGQQAERLRDHWVQAWPESKLGTWQHA